MIKTTFAQNEKSRRFGELVYMCIRTFVPQLCVSYHEGSRTADVNDKHCLSTTKNFGICLHVHCMD